MRVISWNLGKNFKIIEQQLKIVDEEKPDILALQEVTSKSYKIINEKTFRDRGSCLQYHGT